MDKKYWTKYYKLQDAPEKPSLFAKFVLENYIKDNESLIELGCGNGRDSLFFARNEVNVIAIDQCKNEILLLSKKSNLKNLKFICDDFTKLHDGTLFDNIYSRFTLHSISESEEDYVINWAYKNLKKGGRFFIEVRGQQNELYGLGKPVENQKDAYVYEGHYRRFIDINNFKNKLKKVGFGIFFAKENSGFAPFIGTDYKFIRIVAIK